METERLELMHVAADCAIRMPPIEIVGSEFVVRHAVSHDEVRNPEDLVSHGDNRLFVAPMPFDAVIPGLERRALLAGGGQGALDQGTAEIAVAVAGGAAPALAGAFVLARAEAAQLHKWASDGK